MGSEKQEIRNQTVHDDLVTLCVLAAKYGYSHQAQRVEAELARLERERNEWAERLTYVRDKREAAEREVARLERENQRWLRGSAYEHLRESAEVAKAEVARLTDALDGIEKELGTLPLAHLGPATERSVNKAWAMAREKRPDPELIPKASA